MDVASWKGRTALVTGASRGIGRVLAKGLADAGVHLVLVARSEDKLAETKAQCASVNCRVIAADLGTHAGRTAVVEQLGDIDVLVNNAGVEIAVGIEDQSNEDVEAQIAVNLTAAIELTRLLLPKLKEKEKAAIVNISSMSGKSPTPYNAVYAATKHGLNGFTSSLRIELDGTNVTTGVVCPSFVRGTGMWADTGLQAPALMREVPVEKLMDAVWRVMNGAGEILVTPSPVRPLLALQAFFPDLNGPMLRWLGVLGKLKERAHQVAERSSS